jgi:hypothetical protein
MYEADVYGHEAAGKNDHILAAGIGSAFDNRVVTVAEPIDVAIAAVAAYQDVVSAVTRECVISGKASEDIVDVVSD